MSRIVLVATLGLLGLACTNRNGGPIAVSVDPAAVSVVTGTTQGFIASVSGNENPNVTWAVTESNGGSIDALGVYTAPPVAGTFHVVATASADNKTTGTALVTVIPPPSGITVVVSPSSAQIAEGDTKLFAADVEGTTNLAVIWSVQESGGGTIASDGTYTAPASPGTFHVIAASVADSTATGRAVVTVSSPVSLVELSISPASVNISEGATQLFTPAVTGAANPAVIWAVEEPAGGTIGRDGTYIAPAIAGTFHVIATSQADPTASATATVNVTAPNSGIVVSIDPSTASLLEGATQVFSASVVGANNTVTWAVAESGGGTIDSSGNYTAPSTPGTFHILATSAADGSTLGTAIVTISTETLALSPLSVTLDPNTTQAFTALIGGSSASATFSILETGTPSTVGSVSASGVYTSPNATGIFHLLATTPDGSQSVAATIAVSAELSGSVTYSGSASGRIYIEAYQTVTSTGDTEPVGGTSLAAPGPFVIHGLSVVNGASQLQVVAWMDTTQASPQFLDPDPSISSSEEYDNIVSISGYALALADADITAPDQPDDSPSAYPGDGAALLIWDAIIDENGDPEVDHYNLYAIPLAAGAATCPSTTTGALSDLVPGWVPTYALFSGLSNGTSYCFAYSGIAGGMEGPLSDMAGPVEIAVPTGGVSVSGAIAYSGFTPSGPLVVLAFDSADNLGAFTRIETVSASPQAYTLSGLQPGDYQLVSFFNTGNTGWLEPNDPTNYNDLNPATVVINSQSVAGINAVISASNVALQLVTDHIGDAVAGFSESYAVEGSILPGLKTPTGVALLAGPGVVPGDLPLSDYDSFEPPAWLAYLSTVRAPAPGANYQFQATYADGSQDMLTAGVTTDALVSSLSPADGATASSDAPTFSWSAPSPAPASYVYVVYVTSPDGGDELWESADIPSTTTSVAYNADGSGTALSSGQTYLWTVQVIDSDSNSSELTSSFIAP